MTVETITLDANSTLLVAVCGFFIGRWLTNRIAPLRTYSIPEPVTGGLVIAIGLAVLRAFGNIDFDFVAGDTLLLAFFSTVGLNARLTDLTRGGRPLAILLAIAVVAVLIQNVVGVMVAYGLDREPVLGMMAGSISLIGGHGTAAAWTSTFEQISPAAGTIGITAATFGLVAGGLVGGPVGHFLIVKHKLQPTGKQDYALNLPREEEAEVAIRVPNFLASLLVIAVSIAVGKQLNTLIAHAGLSLPQFVTALFSGIVIGNLGPAMRPKLNWPMHTPAMALIAELALALFLVRAMMSLELWTLRDAAGPLAIVLLIQVCAMVLLAYVVAFRALGRTYDAAVMVGGLLGMSLGATPTAVANISALTDKHGPSPLAFLVVPLVGAFFIDLVNAVVITTGWTFLAP
jgi:ESS family glutamate:Na+ symporter